MTDPFATLGLPRTYALSPLAVEEAYFAAQRRFHPDRLVGKPAEERMAAAQASADANDAYRTLLDPLERARALLALSGIRVAGEGDTVAPSQELLAEILERREHLAETVDPSVLSVLQVQAEGDVRHTEERLAEAFDQSDLNAAAHHALRLKYLYALREEIGRHPAWHMAPPEFPPAFGGEE